MCFGVIAPGPGVVLRMVLLPEGAPYSRIEGWGWTPLSPRCMSSQGCAASRIQ